MSNNFAKMINIVCDDVDCINMSEFYEVGEFDSQEAKDELKKMRLYLIHHDNWMHDEESGQDFCVKCAGSFAMDEEEKEKDRKQKERDDG